jgi:hypothetical protein
MRSLSAVRFVWWLCSFLLRGLGCGAGQSEVSGASQGDGGTGGHAAYAETAGDRAASANLQPDDVRAAA